jgi:glycerol-3-phosphate acyltransferase PlsY
MIELGVKFTLAYMLGSLLGSLIVGYCSGGVDIRTLGSGNAGGTNALRTQGKWFALWVMIIDVGKGILAVIVIPHLAIAGLGRDPEIDPSLLAYAVALGAIVGHVFPLWFGFRGGKGGATAAGVLIYFSPVLALPVLGLWLLVVLLTGFVGLATISAALGAVVFIGFAQLPGRHEFFVFACSVALLLVFAHRANIRRMFEGTESRFARPRLDRLFGGK